MKKVILFIVACAFTCTGVQAQSSEVEVASQTTKAEQFKERSSLIKEAEIFKHTESGVKMYAKLFTDLNSGDQLAALEFYATATLGEKLLAASVGVGMSDGALGYLDMDHIDDLLLVLEKILDESNRASKKDKYTISYTTPGGLDVFYATEFQNELTPVVLLRKKWFAVDDYGAQTANYSSIYSKTPIKKLPELIAAIKEAQAIANQSLKK